MKLEAITLRAVRLPLVRPYVLSYRTFNEFEPIIVEARDGDGRIGWGEGHISPVRAARHARAAGPSAASTPPPLSERIAGRPRR